MNVLSEARDVCEASNVSNVSDVIEKDVARG
jgi:hypothetical protein